MKSTIEAIDRYLDLLERQVQADKSLEELLAEVKKANGS